MNKPIIEVKNLSKKYTLGERQPYYSFRDTLSGIFHIPFRRQKLARDEFWALKDISFEINEGDVVGVIGRNGAGKSTLLKILSQITPPTEGEIILRGRVASLLEVGTGFHPELTGRENIYLNGAILGMKHWEINDKFKEIVEFAEIEKFLDTPVKHYSSGMYMRLAFSVAAHLEPEILLIDEVLAVGDTQFQKKCLGKMSEVSKQGRTVIFVSHDMASINTLCKSCILLDKGNIVDFRNTKSIINQYLKKNIYSLPQKTHTDLDLCITDIYASERENKKSSFMSNDPISISTEILCNKFIDNCALSIVVKDKNLRIVFTEQRDLVKLSPSDKIQMSIIIPKMFITPGQYYVDFYLHVPNVKFIDSVNDVPLFEVVDSGTKFSIYKDKDFGAVYTKFTWRTKRI